MRVFQYIVVAHAQYIVRGAGQVIVAPWSLRWRNDLVTVGIKSIVAVWMFLTPNGVDFGCSENDMVGYHDDLFVIGCVVPAIQQCRAANIVCVQTVVKRPDFFRDVRDEASVCASYHLSLPM